jgi:hypothetical protein
VDPAEQSIKQDAMTVHRQGLSVLIHLAVIRKSYIFINVNNIMFYHE